MSDLTELSRNMEAILDISERLLCSIRRAAASPGRTLPTSSAHWPGGS